MPLYQPIVATSQTLITGGGTLALAGFTLTVPATGTAALLGVANVFTAAQEIDRNGIGSTSTDGLILANTTAATVGAQQLSPRLHFQGRGWATGGGASVVEDVILELLPLQSSASTANLHLSFQTNNGGYTDSLLFAPSANQIRSTSSNTFGIDFASATSRVLIGTSNSNEVGVGTVGLVAKSSVIIGWSSAGIASTPAADTAFARNAAAIVEVNTGTAGQWGALKAGTRDAGTTTITDGLTLGHQSTGTPAAGLGVGIQLNINSSTTADQNAARLTSSWSDATHASMTSLFSVFTRTGGAAQAERLRVDAGVGVATNTGLMLWDVDAGALVRVSVGANDSGGAGFKLLRVPN